MARIDLAAKALRAALKEYRRTLIGMLLIGILISFSGATVIEAYIAGALAGYLPGFIAAYEKAYAALAVSREKPETVSREKPEIVRARPKRRLGRLVRWSLITFASLFGLWLLFNVCVWVYR
jgi:DNA-binding transcriptional LysR family regulator